METMRDQIIIFGSGQVGHDALIFFGSENVYGFCDNNLSLCGTKRYGKTVICFEDLKQNYNNAIIVIAVAGSGAYAVAEQCEENGVSDYLIYTYLRETYSNLTQMEFLHFIGDPLNRLNTRKDFYFNRSEELKRQVNFFKRYADIRHMKPAEGKLRYRQRECVRVSTSFFRKIEELEINPILYGGNLLGYIRHNGFIPWDDDIDFSLIRKEYEKLKKYCRQHIYTEDEWNKETKVGEKEILPGMECYYWYLWHDHFCIVEVGSDGNRIGMDFFPLEYYADHYSLSELRTLASRLRDEMICMDSEEEKIRYMEEARSKNRKNVADESNNIYFAIDGTEMRHSYHRDHFIPKDVVFPLRKVLWEGEYFWVPNDPEEFLTYVYENCWDFPDDVGIPSHCGL